MKNILLAFGGNVVEHDISVITAILTIKNINTNLYNLIPFYILEDEFYIPKRKLETDDYLNFDKNKWQTVKFINNGIIVNNLLHKKIKIDCALLCTHGGIYEGGGLQGLLQIYSIPYTSSNILTSSLCMDKAKSKIFFNSLGLNTTEFVAINKSNYEKNNEEYIDKIIENLSFPIIVKPNDQGSSIGINIANNIEDLKVNLQIAFNFSNDVIVENALTDFCEYNCAGLNTHFGITISDIESPKIKNDFLTFNDKYTSDNLVEFPAKIDLELEKQIKSTTKLIIEQLNVKGVSRCDFMYDNKSNKLYINEINTIPGSLAYYLFKNQLSFSEIINLIIESGIEDSKYKLIKKYNTKVLDNFKYSKKLNFNK